MSGSLEIIVIRGSEIRITNTIKDFDGSTLDPDSHLIRLYDPVGSQVGTTETSPSGSGGVYYQDFTITADGVEGEWMVKWKITESGKISIEKIRFRVVA